MEAHPHYERAPNLENYFGVIRARKWTVLLIAILVISTSLAYSFSRTPMYRAESRLVVKPAFPDNRYGQTDIETESQLVASEQVARLVAEDLDSSPNGLLAGLRVSRVGASGVLVVSYTSSDPRLAADAANSFADNYIEHRHRQALQLLDTAREETEVRIRSAESRLSAIFEQINQARAAGDLTLVESLETDMLSLSARRGLLEKDREDLQLGPSTQLGGGEVIERAGVPGSAIVPNHATTGGLGVIFGLGLGLAAAFLRQRLSRRFGAPAEIEQAVRSPLLSTIPRFKIKMRRKSKRAKALPLITLEMPRSAASEAYRTLRMNLQVLMARQELKSVLITSPAAGEGKTLTAANLAVTFAQAGQRVALISGDLRRPSLEKYFELQHDGYPQLSAWLAGNGRSIQLLQPSGIPNLDVIPSGPVPPNPPEMLSSTRMRGLIENVCSFYDLVIIDSAPVLPVADALGLASHVDGVVLVLDAGTTRRSATRHAREKLDQIGTSILGVVLNSYEASLPYYAHVGTYYSSGLAVAVPVAASNGQAERAATEREERGRPHRQ